MNKIIIKGMSEFESLLVFYGTPYMILTYAKGERASEEFKKWALTKYDRLIDKSKLLDLGIDEFMDVFAVFNSKCVISRIIRICRYNGIKTLKDLLDTGKGNFSRMTCSKNFIAGPKALDCLDEACKNAGYSFV